MVSRVVRSPVRAASSRAGRTSPVSKVVSNAEKGPACRAFLLYWDAYLRGFRFLIDSAFGDLS